MVALFLLSDVAQVDLLQNRVSYKSLLTFDFFDCSRGKYTVWNSRFPTPSCHEYSATEMVGRSTHRLRSLLPGRPNELPISLLAPLIPCLLLGISRCYFLYLEANFQVSECFLSEYQPFV